MISFNKRGYKVGLSLLLILLVIIVKITTNSEASTTTYKVYFLSTNGNKIEFGESKLTTTDFAAAKAKMIESVNGVITSESSRSYHKIVAATRSMAHSYPYRKGKDAAGVTLNIYSNTALSSAYTYIPAHYMMYVYDYSLNNGRVIANIEIQGGRGYVEVTKTDIVPMIYIENGIGIMLGGNEDHYKDPEKAYSRNVWQEYYRVEKNGSINELRLRAHRTHPNLYDIDLTYGIAPDFLEVGRDYYSPDGINFYSDRDLNNKVGGDYYSYYQWLPLRSMTNHEPESFDIFLRNKEKNNSIMLGQTHHFIEQGSKYGMNPVLIFQQANLESAYGTSTYAIGRNNIFGWGAVDSDPDQAYTYDNIGVGIQKHMDSQIEGYTKVDNYRHYGISFGNKGAGITVKYASDPYYGMKVASLYYQMDKLNDFKDYNAYNFSKLNDKTSYTIRDKNNSLWYTTKSNLQYQIIVNLGKENGKIITSPWQTKSDRLLDLKNDYGYLDGSGVTDISKYWGLAYIDKVNTNTDISLKKTNSNDSSTLSVIPKGTELVVEQKGNSWARTKYNGETGFINTSNLNITRVNKPAAPQIAKEPIYDRPAWAKITKNLSLLSSYNSSTVLETISAGIELTVESTNLGLARTVYNGKVGYIAMDGLEIIREESPSGYKKGDVNGDGSINSSDYIVLANHILGNKKLSGAGLIAADINGDGNINSADYVGLANHILGRKLIN